jgi:hypothetical protein
MLGTKVTTMPLSKPLDVFFSYAHEDGSDRDTLNTHLSFLKRQGLIRQWSDRDITGGTEWDPEIRRQLEEAHIILLLVSADFLSRTSKCLCHPATSN